MIFSRAEGGIGLRNFRHLQIAMIVECAGRAWVHDDIWACWVRQRYIKQVTLFDIQHRYNDDNLWKHTLWHATTIAGCMEYNSDYSLSWKGPVNDLSLENVWNGIRPRRTKDIYVGGTWASSITKCVNLLWRVQLKRIPMANRLRRRGATIDPTCQLCNEKPESIEHLYFQCPFSNWLLLQGTRTTGGLISPDSDMTFDSLLPKLNGLLQNSPI